MTKNVCTCGECKYFHIQQEVGMCSHPNALPFPKPNDYCSMGEFSDANQLLANSEELLKRVYEQRKQ